MARCSSSHVRTGSRASGTIAQVRIRPSLDVAIKAASSNTERCRITVGRRSPVGPARSVTRAGVSASRVQDRPAGRIKRARGRAARRSGSCLAMSLTIAQFAGGASENFVKSLSFSAQTRRVLGAGGFRCQDPAESCSQRLRAHADACNRRQIPEAASPLPTEIELRQKILERIDRLKGALRIVTPPKHGQIGHNRPPPDDDTPQAQVVTQIQAASEVLQQELKKERPDALAIAHATSKIKSALGYLTKKVDVAVDSFAKTIGASVAVGATAVATSQLSPTFYKLLAEIAQHTLQWLGHIMLPF